MFMNSRICRRSTTDWNSRCSDGVRPSIFDEVLGGEGCDFDVDGRWEGFGVAGSRKVWVIDNGMATQVAEPLDNPVPSFAFQPIRKYYTRRYLFFLNVHSFGPAEFNIKKIFK